jgi:hypothetical protein
MLLQDAGSTSAETNAKSIYRPIWRKQGNISSLEETTEEGGCKLDYNLFL